jgi:death-on-curing protein
MKSIKWIHEDVVRSIHSRQLAEHGGRDGIRDEGLLHSALARLQNQYAYVEDADLSAIAASYAFGIATNHPFIDGNKRTALVVMRVFLSLNNMELLATQQDKYSVMIRRADGAITEDELAQWIRKRIM